MLVDWNQVWRRQKHELRSVRSLSRVHSALLVSANLRSAVGLEQDVGVPQVVNDCDHCVDPPHLSEILLPVRNHRHRLLLRALCSGVFPHGTVFVPEVDFDTQTCQAALPTVQLTAHVRSWTKRRNKHDVDVTLSPGKGANPYCGGNRKWWVVLQKREEENADEAENIAPGF